MNSIDISQFKDGLRALQVFLMTNKQTGKTSDSDEHFDDATIAKLLELQIEADTLDDGKRISFEQTTLTQNRIFTNLPDGEHIYNGTWFYQGPGPTCHTWSIMNAVNATGIKLNPSLMKDLLNTAQEANGLSQKNAARILKQHPNTGIEASHLPRDTTLETIKEETLPLMEMALQPIITRPEDKTIPTRPLYIYHKSFVDVRNKEEIIKRNASVIKNEIDRNCILITCVDLNKGYDCGEKTKDELHSVCVVGYRIKSGCMDVQVLDSRIGKLWMSLEHLSENLFGLTERIQTKQIN